MESESLNKRFEKCIREHWNAPALSNCDAETLLYKDVAWQIVRLQRIFALCGIGRDDKVAMCSRNQANWAVAFLATRSVGAIPVPILSDFRAANIQYIANHSDAKLLFAGTAQLESLSVAAMPQLKAVVRMEDLEVVSASDGTLQETLNGVDAAMKEHYAGGFTPDDVEFQYDTPDDLAIINYTSGTSGFAKGVMLPCRSLLRNMEHIRRVVPHLDSNSNMVSMLPMAHMYGLTLDLLYEMTIGAHVHFMMRPPSPTVIKETFSQIKPDLVMSVPLIVEKVCRKVMRDTGYDYDPAALTPQQKRLACDMLTEMFGGKFSEVVIGGAPLNQQVEDFMIAVGFRYSVGSGMTELGPLVSFSNCKDYKPHTCGRKVFYLDIKIDSPDPQNIPGEVYLRGSGLFMGYYKMPRQTSEVLSGDGWFRTGDIGTLDPDGFLTLKGRCTSMILTAAGQNIFPEEIESLINNMPYVQESLVVSDKNALVALVVPDQDMVAADNMSEADLYQTLKAEIRTLNQELPTYCNISRVEIFPEEFEKTPKNSIKRYLYQR